MPFNHNGATISARPLTIGDDNEIDLLSFRLNDETDLYNAQKWAEFMVGAVVEGDYPLPYVNSKSATEEARHSYAAWQNLPRGFMQKWKAELRKADSDPKA